MYKSIEREREKEKGKEREREKERDVGMVLDDKERS